MRVLVLGMGSRMGRAIVRSLARDHEVIGGSIADARNRPSRRRERSRHVSATFRYPSPLLDPEGFGNRVEAACRELGADAVFPSTTAAAIALSRLRAERGSLPGVSYLIEDLDKTVRLADKWRFHQLCLEQGIPTPRTVLPVEESWDELRQLGLPVIAKPRASEAAAGVRILRTRAELDRLVAHPPRVGSDLGPGEFPYVVQELLPIAGIHDASGCSAAGEVVSMMTVRRVLTSHEFGGAGLVHETTNEPEMAAFAATVMRELSWNGPLELEFVRTPDGSSYAIDANPRVWGDVELAIGLGQDIPALTVAIYSGGLLPAPQTEYDVGVVLRRRTIGALSRCFRAPRRPRTVARRLGALLGVGRRRPRRGEIASLRAATAPSPHLDERAVRVEARLG